MGHSFHWQLWIASQLTAIPVVSPSGTRLIKVSCTFDSDVDLRFHRILNCSRSVVSYAWDFTAVRHFSRFQLHDSVYNFLHRICGQLDPSTTAFIRYISWKKNNKGLRFLSLSSLAEYDSAVFIGLAYLILPLPRLYPVVQSTSVWFRAFININKVVFWSLKSFHLTMESLIMRPI